MQIPQEKPKLATTTVYAGLTWDDIVGAAALAVGLGRKGYRVYVDLPIREEFNNLKILKSYAVGIQPKSGVSIFNSVAMIYSRSRGVGYVFKYDDNGRSEILMKLSTVRSATEVVNEYLATISAAVEIPQQLVDDIVAMNNGGINKLSKIGRVIYGVHKLKVNDKNVRLTLYNYAYSSIATKNLKLPEELLALYGEYDRSVKLVSELIKEDRFITIGPYKVALITSKHSDEFVVNNLSYLKPFASEILSHICRQSSPAFLIYEGSPNVHEIRACVRFNVSIVKVVDSIPKEVLDKVKISTTASSVTIEFNNPLDASFENALDLVTQIISGLPKL
ncbi:MAG: hypothetical protein RMI56_02420 [Sulfolobales archaeon]|nr:hypothetical protein [Sulfolobales archaeon]MDW8082632.1 hypothetical protein [Sulfolobales archaeon]